jgi:hypothetical protein
MGGVGVRPSLPRCVRVRRSLPVTRTCASDVWVSWRSVRLNRVAYVCVCLYRVVPSVFTVLCVSGWGSVRLYPRVCLSLPPVCVCLFASVGVSVRPFVPLVLVPSVFAGRCRFYPQGFCQLSLLFLAPSVFARPFWRVTVYNSKFKSRGSSIGKVLLKRIIVNCDVTPTCSMSYKDTGWRERERGELTVVQIPIRE